MQTDTSDPLVESWNIHNRINLFLFDAIPADAINVTPPAKGRTVGEQFAHIHNVRLMWLKSGNPALLEGLAKLDKEALTASGIRAALEASGETIATLLADAILSDGKVKGFKPHVTAFFAYLISHESHHRGQIASTLRHIGHPLDKKIGFGMWEWGVR